MDLQCPHQGAKNFLMNTECDKKIEDAESAFKTGVEELQASYKKMMEDKEKTVEDIKNAGLGLMKACKAHSAKAKKGTDEL